MQKFKTIYQLILGIFTTTMLILNTIITFIPVFFVGTVKIIPYQPIRNICNKTLSYLCGYWIKFNINFIKYTRNIKWHITYDADLSLKKWYLVTANHQSWLDITVLQRALHNKIPELKFFVKDQLKWVPILGFTWWIFDHPFMKRYSKEFIKKNPAKKGLDLIATQKACQKFNHMPVSIMNFIEGTRFTNEKHQQQKSPYNYLLKPKSGGAAYVLNSLGEKIHSIIDITINYPDKHRNMWDYLCGRIKDIKVNVRQLKIPEQFLNMNYFDDPEIKSKFQEWLNEKWQEKDLIFKNELNTITEK